MACYDCEDCNKSIQNGGKCTRWEYNCPFNHLKSYDEEESKQIIHDFEVAVELKSELGSLIDKFAEKFTDDYNYEEIFHQLKFAHSNLDDLTSDELVKEWKEINF